MGKGNLAERELKGNVLCQNSCKIRALVCHLSEENTGKFPLLEYGVHTLDIHKWAGWSSGRAPQYWWGDPGSIPGLARF